MALGSHNRYLGGPQPIRLGRACYGLAVASVVAFVLSLVLFFAKIWVLAKLDVGTVGVGDVPFAENFFIQNLFFVILLGLPLAFVTVIGLGLVAWQSVTHGESNGPKHFV
mgnify:CR=1 FL=1|tara:strand:+ start:559 stop:888 length:330 start_codon:yes stop_codon:yes gene_type:complete